MERLEHVTFGKEVARTASFFISKIVVKIIFLYVWHVFKF